MTVVNGVAEKYSNTDQSSIPYSDFKKSVMELSQELGETDDIAIVSQSPLFCFAFERICHLKYEP